MFTATSESGTGVIVPCAADRRLQVELCFRTLAAIVMLLAGAAAPVCGQAYVAGYIGGARTRAADVAVETSDPAARLVFKGVRFSGRSFESPIYYGYRAGYRFTRHLGLEAEFIHLKIYADLNRPVSTEGNLRGVEVREQAPMSRYADQFEVSHGLNMVLINAVVRRAVSSRIELVGRAGAGPTIPRPEVIVFGAAGGGYEAGPAAVQAAAGMEARLWRGLRILTEYKYTFTPTSFGIPSGSARLDVHSHHIVTGFAVQFR